eukprot:6124625-Pyramimonas_sp.AAC.1
MCIRDSPRRARLLRACPSALHSSSRCSGVGPGQVTRGGGQVVLMPRTEHSLAALGRPSGGP